MVKQEEVRIENLHYRRASHIAPKASLHGEQEVVVRESRNVNLSDTLIQSVAKLIHIELLGCRNKHDI